MEVSVSTSDWAEVRRLRFRSLPEAHLPPPKAPTGTLDVVLPSEDVTPRHSESPPAHVTLPSRVPSGLPSLVECTTGVHSLTKGIFVSTFVPETKFAYSVTESSLGTASLSSSLLFSPSTSYVESQFPSELDGAPLGPSRCNDTADGMDLRDPVGPTRPHRTVGVRKSVPSRSEGPVGATSDVHARQSS